ncbi:hypothetical protein SDC9_166644 [bioreactor metagenome]|uniref:Uncharacterized protein n=1 Tax=bioreactor metagenome TaxID=1076179 RepID=A0A645FXM3_9ZZZZ
MSSPDIVGDTDGSERDTASMLSKGIIIVSVRINRNIIKVI